MDPVAKADSSAVRVALWRALHTIVDPPPHVLIDEIGLQLAAPEPGWRARPDMHPEGTKLFRASILARARLLEELVEQEAARGVGQYVVLGAGLDTFAQRREELASRLRVFEIDRPPSQAWKRARLEDLGYGAPPWLRWVPVDFEAGESWLDALIAAGFDAKAPAVIASTGVSMYLSRAANEATLQQLAALAPGSTVAMSFLVPVAQADPALRPGLERSMAGARAAGTPFVSFFDPDELIALARAAGFREASVLPSTELAARYFAGRTDGLRTLTGEEMLIART